MDNGLFHWWWIHLHPVDYSVQVIHLNKTRTEMISSKSCKWLQEGRRDIWLQRDILLPRLHYARIEEAKASFLNPFHTRDMCDTTAWRWRWRYRYRLLYYMKMKKKHEGEVVKCMELRYQLMVATVILKRIGNTNIYFFIHVSNWINKNNQVVVIS